MTFYKFSVTAFNLNLDNDDKDEELNSQEAPTEDDSTQKKPNNLLATIKEIDERERQEELLREQRAIKQHDKEREEYSKQVQQDKIELIKLKQGVIDHSDTIHEVHEEAPVLTFPQKVSNFFYHNAWWLWIVVYIVIVASIIIYDQLSTPKPDAVVLMLTYNDDLYDESYQAMADYFENFVDDNNGDGISTVNIYYIPLTIEESNTLFTSYMAKFSGEMQSATSMIVLADSACDERLTPDDVLYSLNKDFGQYDNVEDYAYYLKDTNFAEEIGYTGTISDDLYIGIRSVQSVYDSATKMEENFEVAYEFIDRLIDYQENGVGEIASSSDDSIN